MNTQTVYDYTVDESHPCFASAEQAQQMLLDVPDADLIIEAASEVHDAELVTAVACAPFVYKAAAAVVVAARYRARTLSPVLADVRCNMARALDWAGSEAIVAEVMAHRAAQDAAEEQGQTASAAEITGAQAATQLLNLLSPEKQAYFRNGAACLSSEVLEQVIELGKLSSELRKQCGVPIDEKYTEIMSYTAAAIEELDRRGTVTGVDISLLVPGSNSIN